MNDLLHEIVKMMGWGILHQWIIW